MAIIQDGRLGVFQLGGAQLGGVPLVTKGAGQVTSKASTGLATGAGAAGLASSTVKEGVS
jgi:hypothetical protein